MSTWLLITLSVVVLGGITFLIGEWLSQRLIARAPSWMRRDEPRSDPLAEHDDDLGEAA